MSQTADSIAASADEPSPSDLVDERYRKITLGVVLVGSLMVVLDTSIVNVALPEIRNDLAAGDGIEWVVTAYLLAVAVSQPATGWLADRFGRKRVYAAALACFTVASLACALAPSLGLLVLFRVLQGLGGGAMMPIGMAMVFEVYPPERRGQAMGIWGVAAMAGPAVGPTLGGWLVTSVSWHWLFLVNLPVGVLAMVLVHKLLRDFGYRDDRPLDVLGLMLGGAGLALGLLGVSQSTQWGWGAPSTLSLVGAGVVLLALFVRRGLTVPDPIVNMRIFEVRSFAISMSVIFLTSSAQYIRLVFIPLELEAIRGYSPLRIGLLLIPSALCTAATMPLGGRLMDRIGPRVPVVIGGATMCLASLTLGFIQVDTPIAVIVGLLALQGLGMGLTAAPATVAGMNALSGRYVAQATAMRSLTSQVAGASAIAVASTIVAARMGEGLGQKQAAYNSAFLLAAGGLAIGTLMALRLPRGAEKPATKQQDAEGSALLTE